MAVQQRRVTASRKGMRRSHHHLEISSLVTCKKCGKKNLSHRVCKGCGFYNNRNVLDIES